MKTSATFAATLVVAGASLAGVVRHAAADTTLVNAQANSGGSWSNPVWGPTVTGTSVSGLGNFSGTVVTGTPTVSSTGGGAQLGTVATVTHILGSDRIVTMAWRTRTLNESFPWEPGGNPTSPPMDLANLDFGLASDVVDLTGFAHGEKFVLQMSYDPSLFNESVETTLGCVHINWLNGSGMWVNAVLGNTARDSRAQTNVHSSWVDAGSPMELGSWGVDTVNHVAWAVLDHNSQFAVVPEPASMSMLIGGAATGLLAVIRRRRGRA